jgi:hypothetical protein
MRLDFFNTAICVFDYNYKQKNNLDWNKRTNSAIDNLFALPAVINQANVDDAQGGRALSTAHLHDTHKIPNILNFKENPLGQWILLKIYESAVELGFDKTRNVKKFKYHRTWVNRMGKGCHAIAHRHAGKNWSIPHLVAIYYTDVPTNSADLVFIDDNDIDVMRGNSLDHYPESLQKKSNL